MQASSVFKNICQILRLQTFIDSEGLKLIPSNKNIFGKRGVKGSDQHPQDNISNRIESVFDCWVY
jgi:hypothetical protein